MKLPDVSDVFSFLIVKIVFILAAITIADILDWSGKTVTIVSSIIIGIWGYRHLRSKTELNRELKRGAQLDNERKEQELWKFLEQNKRKK